jgi:hypothetical protein
MLAPDQPMNAEVAGQAAESRDERDADEGEAQHRHQDPNLSVGVLRGVEGRDLVPERVQPEPDLAGIAARLELRSMNDANLSILTPS